MPIRFTSLRFRSPSPILCLSLAMTACEADPLDTAGTGDETDTPSETQSDDNVDTQTDTGPSTTTDTSDASASQTDATTTDGDDPSGSDSTPTGNTGGGTNQSDDSQDSATGQDDANCQDLRRAWAARVDADGNVLWAGDAPWQGNILDAGIHTPDGGALLFGNDDSGPTVIEFDAEGAEVGRLLLGDDEAPVDHVGAVARSPEGTLVLIGPSTALERDLQTRFVQLDATLTPVRVVDLTPEGRDRGSWHPLIPAPVGGFYAAVSYCVDDCVTEVVHLDAAGEIAWRHAFEIGNGRSDIEHLFADGPDSLLVVRGGREGTESIVVVERLSSTGDELEQATFPGSYTGGVGPSLAGDPTLFIAFPHHGVRAMTRAPDGTWQELWTRERDAGSYVQTVASGYMHAIYPDIRPRQPGLRLLDEAGELVREVEIELSVDLSLENARVDMERAPRAKDGHVLFFGNLETCPDDDEGR